MSLTFLPMLLAGKSIFPEIRQALRDDRIEDAAALLMRRYGLNCVEAGDLLDLSLCDQDNEA